MTLNLPFLTINDLKGKKVLVRVDLNVPTQNGSVMDNSRIKHISPTINFLKKSKAKIILISHMGKTSTNNDGESLRIVINELSKAYSSRVIFIDDCLSKDAKKIINDASYEDIILLENLRFYQEEENCDKNFARKLSELADFYINEAFSVSHRKHASICEIQKFLPHAFGIAFLNEITTINNFLSAAKSPKMCIVGGAKLSTKIKFLKNIVKNIDKLAIGGRIAGVFLAFQNNDNFSEFRQEEFDYDIKEILYNSQKFECELILPVDFSALVENNKCVDNASYCGHLVFDIGPKTVKLFKQHISESSSILWNGPLGLFEHPPFDFGTMSIAKEIAILSQKKEFISIIGGGDTAFAMNKFNLSNCMTHVSTSGGAFLAYLEGTELPGIQCMHNAYRLLDENEIGKNAEAKFFKTPLEERRLEVTPNQPITFFH